MSSRQQKIENLTLSYQPEIIRTNQKDEQYQQYTFEKLIKSLEIFIPHVISYRTITKHKSQLKLTASLLYFGFTTLSNIKTFGEEFSGITQINEQEYYDDGVLTSKKRKILFFLCTTVFQYLLRKFTERPYNNYRQLIKANPVEHHSWYNSFIRNLPDYDGIIDKVFKINLTLFFIEGYYLQISKKLLGIKYVFNKKPPQHDIVYDKIGKLILFQFVIEFFRFLYRVNQDYKMVKKMKLRIEEGDSDYDENQAYNQDDDLDFNENVDEDKKCGVCMDRRNNTAATPCGHLFCWDCVQHYVLLKNECPQCRQTCLPQKLVQLRNYH